MAELLAARAAVCCAAGAFLVERKKRGLCSTCRNDWLILPFLLHPDDSRVVSGLHCKGQ